MTPRQSDVFFVIDEHWKMYGYGPTIEQIKEQLGIKSTKSVQRMIDRLVEMGACKKDKYKTRSIRPSGIKFRSLS